MPSVAGFNVTPVKSTALHRPERIELRPNGAVGDRRFLFARLSGERLSGISKASLMPIRSEHDGDRDHLRLTLGDRTAEGPALGHGDAIAVHLFDRDVLARPVDPVFDAFVREVIGDDTLALFRVEAPEYAGGGHRASLLARASVADLGARLGDEALDARRFRMLIEIDGLDLYEEDTWEGRRVRVGGAVIRVGERMPRCVMTTLHPDTGAQDTPVLAALVRYRTDEDGKPIVGVYGDVEVPGWIAVGDTVEPLPA
jgi:uncharacterized protein YcbX